MRPESKKYLYDILRAREIINLRNVIVHGYTVIENETIWGILQADVPKLRDQVARLLE